MIGSTNARNAGGGGGTYQAKQVTPSNSTQLVTPDTGYDALSSVTVNAIDEIPNLTPENIKKGVQILNMTGTFNAFPNDPSGGLYFSNDDENGYPRKCTVYNWKRTGEFSLGFNNSFWNKLEEIEFINSDVITAFPASMCQGLAGLRKFSFPSSLTSWGNGTGINTGMFNGCLALNNITLPEGLITIGSYGFYGCSGLTTIHFPSTLSSIGTGAGSYNDNMTFYDCSNLEFVTFANGFNCNYLKLNASSKYSVETLVNMFTALKDRTGEASYRLTIGTTNLNKLTAEQRAIATNKNWTLA